MKTDFENLLFCENYIKLLKQDISALKIELGIRQSEIDELNHRINYGDSPIENRNKKYTAQIENLRLKVNEYKKKWEDTTLELIKIKNLSNEK